MAESGLLHDDLVALGRAVSNSGVSQYPPDMLSFQSGFMPPDPFAGVYNDAYSRRYAAQIQANSIRNAGAFARRAREEADRRLAGDLITDVASGLGFVAGMPAGGTIGGMAGSLAMNYVTEQILQATGFFDFDPLVSLNEQAQAMVDSSIHQFAFSMGGLGLDRGISMDAARDIGSQLFDQARGAGLHGVEVSRMMNAMEPYAAQLHLSKDPRELGDQLEKYLDGLIEVVQRTNTSIERASQMLAQGTMMGISPENAGSTFATIAGYAGVADISPSQMMQIGMQAATPFSGTGFGYGDVLASTASTMAGASLASMNSRNATLWAAIGGPQQFGIHQANLASSFAANPEMVGRLMGSGSFDYANWNNMMSGSALSDGYGDAYSELNTNDKLLAQYNGMQEMLARPGQWERAALGSVLGQMIEDDITNPNSQAVALWRSGYAPNLATGRQMVSSFQAQQSNHYGASILMAAEANRMGNEAESAMNNVIGLTNATSVASSIALGHRMDLFGELSRHLGSGSTRASLADTYAQITGEMTGSSTDAMQYAGAVSMYALTNRRTSQLDGVDLAGTPESMAAAAEAMGDRQIYDPRMVNRQFGELTGLERELYEPLVSAVNDQRNQVRQIWGAPDINIDRWNNERLSILGLNLNQSYRTADAISAWDQSSFAGFTTGATRVISSAASDVWSGIMDSFSAGQDVTYAMLTDAQNAEIQAQRDAIIEGLARRDPSQYLTQPYQAPMVSYAMQSGWAARNLGKGDSEFASAYNLSLEEIAIRDSMLDSDQMSARLNQWQDASSFNPGWHDFLTQVTEENITFVGTGNATADFNRVSQRLYGADFGQISESNQEYIRTYAAMSGADPLPIGKMLLDLGDLSTRSQGDDIAYRQLMSRLEDQYDLRQETISQIALFGQYRARVASDDISSSERTSMENAMNQMALDNPSIRNLTNQYYGSIAASIGSRDMIQQVALGGTLDEQIAIQEDIWSRAASSSASTLIGNIASLDELRNIDAATAKAMFQNRDIGAYGSGIESIINTLMTEGGSAVTSSQILALQDFDYLNTDAPGPNEESSSQPNADGSETHPLHVIVTGVSDAARSSMPGVMLPFANWGTPNAETPTGEE